MVFFHMLFLNDCPTIPKYSLDIFSVDCTSEMRITLMTVRERVRLPRILSRNLRVGYQVLVKYFWLGQVKLKFKMCHGCWRNDCPTIPKYSRVYFQCWLHNWNSDYTRECKGSNSIAQKPLVNLTFCFYLPVHNIAWTMYFRFALVKLTLNLAVLSQLFLPT